MTSSAKRKIVENFAPRTNKSTPIKIEAVNTRFLRNALALVSDEIS